MINFYEAHNLHLLAEQLAKDIAAKCSNYDPLTTEWVIVQNKEIQTWLHAELSRINGISANLKFVYPSELIWQILRLYKPELPTILPTDRTSLEARILDSLASHKEELEAKGLTISDNITSRISLAESISDVFDLYQVFRPEHLTIWKNGFFPSKQPISWQALLWQKVIQAINIEFPELPDRTEVQDIIHSNFEWNISELPERCFIFGLSHWSKEFFDFVSMLNDRMDVYWYDQELSSASQNSKFFDWGKSKIDLQKFFFEIDQSVLKRVVLADENVAEISETKIISIHSCHNIEREVQVLKNQLLSQFDLNSELGVDDVLIMVPDFEAYTPVIQTELNGSLNYPNIPVYVPTFSGHSSSKTVMGVLDYFLNNEKISDFFDLLAQPTIKNTFKIDEQHIRFYNKVCANMNIHSGLTKGDSAFSLEKGIQQLFLSYSMEQESYQIIDDLVLLELQSNSEAKVLIAKLSSILRWFKELKQQIHKEQTLLEWTQLLINWMGSKLKSDEIIFGQLEKLKTCLEYSNSFTAVSFDAFCSWFSRHSSDESATSTRMGSGITISTYIPYRNVPFKFVAMLGFNEGAFPRNPYRPEFDLIQQNPKPGDRITKENDKLLFLERLISTENHLHLSFIGEGEQAKLPSPLIVELMDEIPGLNIHKHKLHSFSIEESKTTNVYRSIGTDISKLIENSEVSSADRFQGIIKHETKTEIQLSDLLIYFAHPSKYLLSNILGVKNLFEEEEPDDRESYYLDGLGKYYLKHSLLDNSNFAIDKESFKNYGKSKGFIPRGYTGSSQFSEQLELVESIVDHVHKYAEQTPSYLDVRLEINGKMLSGNIRDIFKNERVIWKVGAIKPKEIIQLWMNHLVASIVNPEFQISKIIGLNDKNRVIQQELKPVKNPENYLAELIRIFQKVNTVKEDWSSIPSLAMNFTLLNDRSEQTKALEKSWYSSKFSRMEDADYYNRVLWSNTLPWENDQFENLSLKIWKPILEYLEDTRL